MRPTTKESLLCFLNSRKEEMLTQKEINETSMRDYTSGGPIRSEKTELANMQLNASLQEKNLATIIQLLAQLATAPTNLQDVRPWAEIQLRYEEDAETERILIMPEETSGVVSRDVVMVTFFSPIAQALLGKKRHDKVVFLANGLPQRAIIESVH